MPDSLAAVQQHLQAPSRDGSSTEVEVSGAVWRMGRATDSRSVTVRGSMFRHDSANLYLIRLGVPPSEALAELPDAKTKLLKAVESAPDGFVVTDDLGNILTANAAFFEMVQLPNEAAVLGEPLDRWVGQTGMDLDVLVSNLRQRGTVRFFSTVLRTDGGRAGTVQVEISAVSVRNGGHPSFGYAIRNVGPRVQTVPPRRRPPDDALRRAADRADRPGRAQGPGARGDGGDRAPGDRGGAGADRATTAPPPPRCSG